MKPACCQKHHDRDNKVGLKAKLWRAPSKKIKINTIFSNSSYLPTSCFLPWSGDKACSWPMTSNSFPPPSSLLLGSTCCFPFLLSSPLLCFGRKVANDTFFISFSCLQPYFCWLHIPTDPRFLLSLTAAFKNLHLAKYYLTLLPMPLSVSICILPAS